MENKNDFFPLKNKNLEFKTIELNNIHIIYSNKLIEFNQKSISKSITQIWVNSVMK